MWSLLGSRNKRASGCPPPVVRRLASSSAPRFECACAAACFRLQPTFCGFLFLLRRRTGKMPREKIGLASLTRYAARSAWRVNMAAAAKTDTLRDLTGVLWAGRFCGHLTAELLRDNTRIRQGLLPAREASGEFGSQIVCNFLKRSSSVHQVESSAAQEPVLGKLRNVVCRYPAKLRGGQHCPGQLRLLKMNEGSARSSEGLDVRGPSPDVFVFHQFCLKAYANGLALR